MDKDSYKETNLMKYKEIVNFKSDKLSCSIESLSCFLDKLSETQPDLVEKELIRQIGIFNNRHFNKVSAEYVIAKMKSSIDKRDVFEILSEKGINVNTAKSKIEESYRKAKELANTKNYTAPEISNEYNEWDYYVVLAMCTMDFWCEGLEDLDKVNCLAYEWLADIDSCTTKVWDYFFGNSTLILK